MVRHDVIATLSVFGLALAEDYVPLHKRFTYTHKMNDFSYLGMLARRDACSDQFGEKSSDSTCAPDFTLCCITRGEAFPSCQQYLSRGWCCVAENDDDDCYMDSESMCDSEDSVPCPNLAEGTDRACCMRGTECDPNVPAASNLVRCTINQGDLKRLNSESIASTATRSSPTSTNRRESSSTATSSHPSSTTSAGSNQDDGSGSSSGLSGGAIAGIVVGALAGLALVGIGLFFLFRHERRAKYEAANQGAQPSVAQFYENQAAKDLHHGETPYGGHGAYGGYQTGSYLGTGHPGNQNESSAPSELAGQREAAEMDGVSHAR